MSIFRRVREWWVNRSARTGRFVSKADADRNRDTTYRDRVTRYEEEDGA